MADVFLSYASADRDRAGRLASALGAVGWSVWWDRKIVAGQAYDQAIERELDSARSVVVLWSSHSIASEWVKNEAAVAAERGVLVPATIERVKLPLEFRRRQTADLSDWNGQPDHGGFRALCEGISTAMSGTPAPQSTPQSVPRSTPPRKARRLAAAIVIVVVVLGSGIYASGVWRTPPPPTSTPTPTVQQQPSGEATEVADLADLVVGQYHGDVISDSKGSSRSDVGVTITKLDRTTVRVTSDYRRLGTIDITLTRIGGKILNADGDSPFVVDLDQHPPGLQLNPHNELAYAGRKRR